MGQLNFQGKRLFEFFQANLRATHRCTIQTLFRVENYLTKISRLRNVTPTLPLALGSFRRMPKHLKSLLARMHHKLR